MTRTKKPVAVDPLSYHPAQKHINNDRESLLITIYYYALDS